MHVIDVELRDTPTGATAPSTVETTGAAMPSTVLTTPEMGSVATDVVLSLVDYNAC